MSFEGGPVANAVTMHRREINRWVDLLEDETERWANQHELGIEFIGTPHVVANGAGQHIITIYWTTVVHTDAPQNRYGSLSRAALYDGRTVWHEGSGDITLTWGIGSGAEHTVRIEYRG